MTGHALIGTVFAPEPLGRAAVVFAEGRILDVVSDPLRSDLPRYMREVDGLICPGFVELQINGSFGLNVGPDGKALKHLARELPKTGTTSFLPTLVSSPRAATRPFWTRSPGPQTPPAPGYRAPIWKDLSSPRFAREHTTPPTSCPSTLD